MVKKTINFHDEKVLEKFDKQITKKYGSIRGNRTNVLEMLMNEYSSGTYEENNEKLEQLNQKVSELTTKYESLGRSPGGRSVRKNCAPTPWPCERAAISALLSPIMSLWSAGNMSGTAPGWQSRKA